MHLHALVLHILFPVQDIRADRHREQAGLLRLSALDIPVKLIDGQLFTNAQDTLAGPEYEPRWATPLPSVRRW